MMEMPGRRFIQYFGEKPYIRMKMTTQMIQTA